MRKIRPDVKMVTNPETTKFLKALLWLTLCVAAQRTQAATTTSTKLKDQVKQQIYNLNEADENGVYLLGVFDVHRPAAGAIGCGGPIDLASGESSSRRAMQNLWAFLWAIDQVNQDDTLLPGVRLGSLVLDSCSSLLQTNQQLANLLQGHHTDLPSRWQFAGLVADQRDWRSVEASASIASSLGSMVTFVTQTRSTKLAELALSWRSRDVSEAGVSGSDQLPQVSSDGDRGDGVNDQRFLKDLLGIGHMLPALELPKLSPADVTNQQAQQTQAPELRLIKMVPGNELMADALASLCDQMKWDLISIVYDSSESDLVDLHDELIRELFLRNTQLALDEPFPLGPALTLTMRSGPEATSERASKQQEQLLMRLAQKSQMGSRVVISLLGIQAARQLQSKLKELRDPLNSTKLSSGQLQQLNSLQWITITDREPYYSYATDSLGTIAVSSASSLMPEFKQFYDKLKLSAGSSSDASATGNTSSALLAMQQPHNKWWPEYVRALMQRHRSELGDLLVDECAKWQEPTASTLKERCRQLDLSTLVQLEKSHQRLRGLKSLMSAAASANSNQNKPPNKLAKFLASGWDHNGMDVINSVLTIANGLELVKQSLCPNTTMGLCAEMRQLIKASHEHDSSEREQTSQDAQAARRSLSELVHEELFGVTFQLADSRLFKLPPRQALDSPNSLAALISAAHSGGNSLGSESANLLTANDAASSSQLDTKLKFYNLRFLSANSIGFVKFAHFHKDEGLVMMGKSQALHYSSLPQNYSDTTPVEQVKSSCQDDSRCLMLSSSVVEAPAARPGQTIRLDEEQLASKLNSLFKLDHPLISQGGSGADFVSSPSGMQGRQNRSDSPQDSTITTMRTMRSLPTQFVHFHDPFASSPLEERNELQARERAKSRRLFEVIVLLPLHHANNSHNNQQQRDDQGDKSASCPPEGAGRLDAAHSFPRLAALAYAQQLVNGRLEALASGNNVGSKPTTDDRPRQSNSSQARAQQDGAQSSNELIISVIDYCGQKDLAAESLARVLRSRRSMQQQQQPLESIGSSTRSSAGAQPPRLVAVLDFDARLSSRIDAVLASTNYSHLLHLSIAQRTSENPVPLRPIVSESNLAKSSEGGPKQLTKASKRRALRVDLMPSKAHEIEAMVKLLKSFPNWRLVHLIYADQHEFRDEFIRRANEANICVSKLIWIPQVAADADEVSLEQLVNKTRQLFERELFHLKQGGKFTDESTAVTHVLVVLASSSHATNKLILRAATQPMLKDYVWLTSHEWLESIERPMEAEIDSMDFSGGGGSKRLELPKNFLSTVVESFAGSHGFRQYFSHLLPALHEPLPDDWFDELWEQHFQCKLAFSKHHRDRSRNDCNYTQRLDLEHMGPDGQDELVPYAIRAIEALHMALVDFGDASSATSLNGRDVDTPQFERLERDFRQAFDLGTREVVGNVDSSLHQANRRHPQALVGFHIVHRVLPKREYIKWSGRAIEEPKMSFYHLARVGLWRDHYQLKHGLKLALASFGSRRWDTNKTQVLANSVGNQSVEDLKSLLRSRPVSIQATLEQQQLQSLASQNYSDLRLSDESNEDLQELKRSSDSLQIISNIDSQCLAKSTCSQLCKRQIEQTFTLIKLEEARLSLNEQVSGEEPRASSNLFVSSLDAPKSNFDDDNDDHDEDQDEAKPEPQATNETKQSRDSLDRNELDDIQAAASSLFDTRTSQQVASDTRRSYRRHFSTQRSAGGLFAFGHSDTEGAGAMRRYSGLLLSVLSMVGVAFTVASMTYFYPNMLDKRQSLELHQQNDARRLKRFNQSSRSTSSSQCNIIMEDEDEETHQGHYPERECFLSSILDNIADYLLLTGLLMLYSINVAFILPATVGVCWFRRVGLAMSYTIVFSSILVKVREIRARQLAAVSNRKSAQQQANRRQLEPVAKSSELAIKPNGRNSMGRVASISSPARESQRQDSPQVASQVHPNSLMDPFRLPLGLILVQLGVSMVWLIEQPPEPTLYQHSCWHCASLARSPVLFLYEPLLSLIGPAFILIVSWLWSIVAFNEASKRDSELSQHIKQVGLDVPPPARVRRQQRQLSGQLHDSKLLVIASTLLVLLWASLTLSVVSTSQRLLWGQNSSGDRAKYKQQVAVVASHTDDQALVYANLLSGAIVFSLLSIYRLGWLGLFGCSGSSKASHYDEIEGALAAGVTTASRQKRRAPFRLFISRRGSSNLGGSASEQQVHKFNATSLQSSGSSEATTSGNASQERLKLQQFNMTYGTYSAGSTASRHQEDTTDLRGSCKSSKSRGLFKLKSKAQKGCSSSQLQRRQSNGSLASSQVPLVASQRSSGRSRGRSHLGGASLDEDGRNNSDAVSCNGSIASNATCQLQGSDLKPIMLDFLRVLQMEHSQLQQRQLDGEMPLDSLVVESTPEEEEAAAKQLEQEEEEAARQEEAAKVVKEGKAPREMKLTSEMDEQGQDQTPCRDSGNIAEHQQEHQNKPRGLEIPQV